MENTGLPGKPADEPRWLIVAALFMGGVALLQAGRLHTGASSEDALLMLGFLVLGGVIFGTTAFYHCRSGRWLAGMGVLLSLAALLLMA